MPRRLVLGAAAAAALALVIAAACGEVSTNPTAPVAIELYPPPLPSVVVGDSMRDSTGAVVGLRAYVFNGKNDTIPGAAVRFLALDSTHLIGLDSVLGTIAAYDTGQVLVYAGIGGLQSIPDTIIVVDTPAVMVHVDSLVDTLAYTFNGRDTSQSLRVRLLHLPDSVAVRRYLVRYTFVYPEGYDNTDSTNVQLVNLAGTASTVDTTDATGSTNRALRITPFTHPVTDSLVLDVSATAPGGGPAGSPVRYVVHVSVQ